jgi:hypothetical protein
MPAMFAGDEAVQRARDDAIATNPKTRAPL